MARLTFDHEQDVESAPQPESRTPRKLARLVVSILLASLVIGGVSVWALRDVRGPESIEVRTHKAYARLSSLFDELAVPPTFALISKDDAGQVGLLGLGLEDNPPRESRFYRWRGRPETVSGATLSLLRTGGWTIDATRCDSISAHKGPAFLYIDFYDSDDLERASLDCPLKAWRTAFVMMGMGSADAE